MRAGMVATEQVILSGSIRVAEATGDEFEGTVREHARLVYKVAYSVLRNHHDAEDVAQETFLRFYRQRRPRLEIRNLRGWLARTAWRVALSKRRNLPEVSFDEAAEAVLQLKHAGASVEEIAANRQMAALLERLIAGLPRDLRDVLMLSMVEEMKCVEIAEVLGIPEGSVRTRLLRARELLRDKLSALLEPKHGR